MKTYLNKSEVLLEGLEVLEPFFVKDTRGYFLKNFEKNSFDKINSDSIISECFESYSYKGVLRGLHFQLHEPQSKLIRVISGEIYDVAVDLRPNSDTFGKWFGLTLNDQNRKSFFIGKGFAHGFFTLSDYAIVSYLCFGKYLKEYDTGIVWNDKTLDIDWPIKDNDKIIVSDRDSMLISFEDFKNNICNFHLE